MLPVSDQLTAFKADSSRQAAADNLNDSDGAAASRLTSSSEKRQIALHTSLFLYFTWFFQHQCHKIKLCLTTASLRALFFLQIKYGILLYQGLSALILRCSITKKVMETKTEKCMLCQESERE